MSDDFDFDDAVLQWTHAVTDSGKPFMVGVPADQSDPATDAPSNPTDNTNNADPDNVEAPKAPTASTPAPDDAVDAIETQQQPVRFSVAVNWDLSSVARVMSADEKKKTHIRSYRLYENPSRAEAAKAPKWRFDFYTSEKGSYEFTDEANHVYKLNVPLIRAFPNTIRFDSDKPKICKVSGVIS